MSTPTRVGIAPALPVLDPSPAPDPRVSQLASLPRAELVSRLQSLDSSLTNARLLGGLQRPKLAQMLITRMDAREDSFMGLKSA